MHKGITNLMRVGLMMAGILSVACTESLGPSRGAKDIGAPLFSFAASGITLHTDNGALGYSGQVVRKGFDRRDANNQIIHPNPGDAIVATFYWVNPSGSTGNIIDSVRDVYTDASFTPIGNTYHLVDFITAGGISMATYAATAVHFDTTSGYVFAVEADFGASIPDGGVKMTAWTGVEDVFANALGSFHSASVSASTPTPLAPGPMTIGPGSMAYGVTLSNGGVNMGSRPAQPVPWTIVGGGIGSDGQLQDDGDYYRSPGGETINPQWTWDFQHASTAVLTVLELKPGTGSSTGNLTVNASTSGSSLDPDGYTITVDGGSAQAIGINGSVSYTNLPSGGHTVAISGVAANCSVSGGTSQTVTVPSGGTATASFAVSCSASTGNLTVTTNTTGSNLDPDGYTITVDGGSAQAIGINGSVSYTNLPSGSHTVAISGVATNCSVSGGTSQSVTVPSGGTATAAFSVSCTASPGNLTVTTSTSGSSLDPDGYTVTVDGGSSQAIGINGSVTFTNLASGSHSVVLSGVATNCTVSGGASRTVTVPSGGTATVAYSVSCTTPAGNLAASTSTSGSSLDPDGYTVTVDGGSSQAIGINSSVTFTNLPPGSHGVVLSGVATNCTVSGGTSRTVNVPSGGTATVSYAVSCTTPNSPPVVNAGPDQTAITGLLYSFSWSFSDANNNGPWSYTIDWGDGSRSTGSVSSQGTYSSGHTYVILLPRNFTIRVTVTDAAGASASDTKVVSVLLL